MGRPRRGRREQAAARAMSRPHMRVASRPRRRAANGQRQGGHGAGSRAVPGKARGAPSRAPGAKPGPPRAAKPRAARAGRMPQVRRAGLEASTSGQGQGAAPRRDRGAARHGRAGVVPRWAGPRHARAPRRARAGGTPRAGRGPRRARGQGARPREPRAQGEGRSGKKETGRLTTEDEAAWTDGVGVTPGF